VLLWPAAEEAADFMVEPDLADFTAAVPFMAALVTTVLYRTHHSIWRLDFVMIMTSSSVVM
jgi:hypothetical protein